MSEPPLPGNRADVLSLSGPALTAITRAVLGKGVPFRFRARGASMRPFIRDGDVITVTPLSGNLPRYGDVAAFIRPGTRQLVIHRVVGKSNGSFLIKGDNSFRDDGFIPLANILGRVTKVERDQKKVYLGLGPERCLIAFLTRSGLLYPLLFPVWRLIRLIIKRRRHEQA